MHPRVQAVIDEIETHLATWEPQSGRDLDEMLGSLPDLMETLAGAASKMAAGLGGNPIEQSVIHELEEAAASFTGAQEGFEQVYQQHRQAHEKELERLEEPRPNEQMWDVSQQDEGL